MVIIRFKNAFTVLVLLFVSFSILKTGFFCAKVAYDTDFPLVKDVLRYNQDSTNINEFQHLILHFDIEQRRLFLTVYGTSPDFNDPYYYIRCYTDAYANNGSLIDEVYINHLPIHFDNKNSIYVYELELIGLVGQYWCNGWLNNTRSNTVIAYKESGNDFALGIKINTACGNYSICEGISNPEILIENVISDWLNCFYYNQVDVLIICMDVRIMQWSITNTITNDYLEATVHLTTNNTLENLMTDYDKINDIVYQPPTDIEVIYFRSSFYCLPETTIIVDSDNILFWSLIEIHHNALSNTTCISEKGVPQVRTCNGNFTVGAFWSKEIPKCSNSTPISKETQLLASLVNKPMTKNISSHISKLTENAPNFTYYDLYNAKKALDKMYDLIKIGNQTYIEDMVKIVSNLMLSNKETIQEAENLIDCPSELLHTFERAVEEIQFTDLKDGLSNIKENNVAVEWVKPYINNITNFVVSNSAASANDIINFNASTAVQDFMQEASNKLMVVIPDTIFNANTLNEEDRSRITIAITAFSGNTLFASNNINLTVISEIVGVSVSEYRSYLPEPITVYFRSNTTISANMCAYWDYGDKIQGKKAGWSTIGGSYVGRVDNSSFIECSFYHLTHFALLIVNDLKFTAESLSTISNISNAPNNIKYSHIFNLDIVTALGSILSFIGIFVVLLTAIIFKKWRQQSSSKMLLQLALVIFLELSVSQIAGLKYLNSTIIACRVVGILLHYIVLSKFCWMLVFAFLQYNRYVTVLGTVPERVVLKSGLFGWGTSLIPVVLTVALAIDSYTAGSQGFCYPKGLALYLGIFLPAFAIVVINSIVLCYIMYKILQSNNTNIRSTNHKSQRFQICIAILLFFMLGIPWIFGILAELSVVNTGLFWVFVYLFSLTASLQGFVLCLFYIILNKDVRNMWITFFKSKCYYYIYTVK